MWHCNWGFPFAHGNWFFPGPFGLLLNLLLGVVIVYFMIRLGRAIFVRNEVSRDNTDSLEILRSRFARGEISAEEYHRMQDILSR